MYILNTFASKNVIETTISSKNNQTRGQNSQVQKKKSL